MEREVAEVNSNNERLQRTRAELAELQVGRTVYAGNCMSRCLLGVATRGCSAPALSWRGCRSVAWSEQVHGLSGFT